MMKIIKAHKVTAVTEDMAVLSTFADYKEVSAALPILYKANRPFIVCVKPATATHGRRIAVLVHPSSLDF